MSERTEIQWASDSWNFLSGCDKVSRGCKFCYAARLSATRLRQTEKYKGLARQVAGVPRWIGGVRVHEDALTAPLAWSRGKKAPRRIFVCSMSDLFHADVPNDVILKAFSVMKATPYHRYIILTKRPDRMANFMRRLSFRDSDWGDMTEGEVGFATDMKRRAGPRGLPKVAFLGSRAEVLQNVALGVSVEGREEYEARIEYLKATPAALRFLSVEPLVEDLGSIVGAFGGLNPVRWVIVGGTSGPSSKVDPFDFAWAESLHEQTERNGVDFFYKQPGSRLLYHGEEVSRQEANKFTRGYMDGQRNADDPWLPAQYPTFFDRNAGDDQ